MGDTRIAHKMFAGNPEGKTPLRTLGYKLEVSINLNLA
jgi:hypothetical protein